MAEVFRGSDPLKAVLLHAHENGAPRILKIGTSDSVLREMEVWNAMSAQHHGNKKDTHLVPLKHLQFKDAAVVQVGDISGGSSVPISHLRSAILITHY